MALNVNHFRNVMTVGGQVTVSVAAGQYSIRGLNWGGRAVAWVRSHFEGAAVKQARGQANMATKAEFLATLKLEYGARIADEVMQQFGIDVNSTKPLLARQVGSALASADDRRTGIATQMHAHKLTLAAGTTRMTRACDLAHVDYRMTADQTEFFNNALSDELDRLSDGNRVGVDAATAEQAAVKVARLAQQLGPEGAKAVNAKRQEMVGNMKSLATQLSHTILPGSMEQAKLCDTLLAIKRNAEDIARLQGRPLAGAEDTLSGMRAPLESALGSLSRGQLENLRGVLTDKTGTVQAFMAGSGIDGSGTAFQVSCSRARSVLENMLDVVGLRLGLTAGERKGDLDDLREGAGGFEPPPGAREFGAHLAYRLEAQTFDPAAATLDDVIDGGNEQLRTEFVHFATVVQNSPDNGKYIRHAHAIAADPTLANLDRFAADLDEMNISGANRQQFLAGLAALHQAEQAGTPPTPAQMTALFAPIRKEMDNMIRLDVLPRFQADAAHSAAMQ